MLRTLSEKVDPKHAALVVIDMQNDFCHEKGATAQDGGNVAPAQAMVPRLQQLIDGAHQAGVHVVFTQAGHSEWTDTEVRLERRIDRSPTCMEGTWGADFYGVFPQPEDMVLRKPRFSAFIGTDFDLVLRNKGIKTLLLTGTVTNVCVESTAREGFMRDYYIVVVDDAVAGGKPGAHEASLRSMDGTFAVLAGTKDVLGAWAKAAGKPKEPMGVTAREFAEGMRGIPFPEGFADALEQVHNEFIKELPPEWPFLSMQVPGSSGSAKAKRPRRPKRSSKESPSR